MPSTPPTAPVTVPVRAVTGSLAVEDLLDGLVDVLLAAPVEEVLELDVVVGELVLAVAFGVEVDFALDVAVDEVDFAVDVLAVDVPVGWSARCRPPTVAGLASSSR